MKMLFNQYALREFVEEFQKVKREDTSHKKMFAQLKTELNKHLKKYDATIKDLQELDIYIQNYSLAFSYTEISGQPLEVRVIWRINELDENKMQLIVNSFCKTLKLESIPKIQITNVFTRNNFALYYPDQRTILISRHFMLQNKIALVRSVVKHEIIHHYCFVNDLPMQDTDADFIRLLIKHNAFISLEKEAQKAYKAILEEDNK